MLMAQDDAYQAYDQTWKSINGMKFREKQNGGYSLLVIIISNRVQEGRCRRGPPRKMAWSRNVMRKVVPEKSI